ncbi:MAG: prepilin peptidase [Candidatus Palauibacterales bacterium]|nr:prepilin peptidase [Candidatus Palauibacterales bacterium]MDP2530331.1 prepilin peptidase [Candidatus Palauibacterales bacterium]MDP2582667.1 prepilin peptidase [Candidatus Palauibacterales bacterium]
MLNVLCVAYAALLGAAVGSFLNVCIARLPAGESVVTPRSRCPNCASQIRWFDNLPVLSYVWLGGRCRDCGERISIVYPLVELAGALIWGGAALLYGPEWKALQAGVFVSLLLAIALIDARHYLIPDVLSLGGLGAGLALSLLPGPPTPLTSVAGAATGFLALFVVGWLGEKALRRPAMGAGDVKMMAMVGAFLGPTGALLTIFLGALLGSVIFGPISLKTKRLVPFGVFLALGATVALVAGQALIGAYLRLVGLG